MKFGTSIYNVFCSFIFKFVGIINKIGWILEKVWSSIFLSYEFSEISTILSWLQNENAFLPILYTFGGIHKHFKDVLVNE